LLPRNFGLAPQAILNSCSDYSDTKIYRELRFLSLETSHGQGWPRECPQGHAGFFYALIPSRLAFFFGRGIVCSMSESDRNALASKLAEIDQLIATNEEVLFSLDDNAWTQAEKSLGKLLELRQELEWELMAQ
jgi:hypothetical protein